MGYTPGLLIVGLFGIMVMWMYGYFWITGMLLVAGGCSSELLLILLHSAYLFDHPHLMEAPLVMQVVCAL